MQERTLLSCINCQC